MQRQFSASWQVLAVLELSQLKSGSVSMDLTRHEIRKRGATSHPNWLMVAFVSLGLAFFAEFTVTLGACGAQEMQQDAAAAAGQQPAGQAAERPQQFSRSVVIELHGPIGPSLLDYFAQRLRKAERLGADLVLVDIDSPGGTLTESLELARLLQQVNWAHTVAFIPKDAYSGAALAAFGCDEIVMGAEGQIGDIGVIAYDPLLQAYRYAEAKWESALISEARSIAEAQGHPPDVVEAMIDKDVALYVYSPIPPEDANAGGPNAAGPEANLEGGGAVAEPKNQPIEFRKISIADGSAPAERDGPWLLIPESGLERFLTLNAARAGELGVVSGAAGNRDELLDELNAPPAIRVFKRRFADHFAFFCRNPWITGLVILIGCVALYIELSAPGIGAGGVIAALCAVLFFWSRFIGGTAGWLEVLLFVAGVACLLMEVFVIPGWGISGLIGLLLVFCGALLASQSFIFPSEPAEWNQLGQTAMVFLGATVSVIAVSAVISKTMGRIPVLSQMVLAPQTASPTVQDSKKPDSKSATRQTHPLVSVGDWGVAESVLRPAGRAKFAERTVDVVSQGQYIEPGTAIRVLEVRGNLVVVESAES